MYDKLFALHQTPRYRAQRFWQFIHNINIEYAESTAKGAPAYDLYNVTDARFERWLDRKLAGGDAY
ncbi:hypothetical protein [Listeria booriae]|uniref:hypothetical protein n=1 Tax=Listeria booriae TaxID=1552123 RepID=UPI00163D4143|nr:hypothetical protein [Listeria booriae]MBC1306856.1 hypothetical protein [Listeria booriae]